MTAFALTVLVVFFHCSGCKGNQGLGLSTSNKRQIACAQMRGSGCPQPARLGLQCHEGGLTVTAKSKAMRPGYRSFMAGKVKFNIKRHTTRLSWDAALRVCQSEGGSLVKIDTKKKEAVIEKNVKIKRYVDDTEYLWIGLRYFKVGGKFLWTDKTPEEYENWRWGEPSHVFRSPAGQLLEDCVAIGNLYVYGITWNDRNCNQTSGFICEVE